MAQNREARAADEGVKILALAMCGHVAHHIQSGDFTRAKEWARDLLREVRYLEKCQAKSLN